MEMKDVTSTTFGYVIAFLLPGIVCLYGCGYWSSSLRDAVVIKPGTNSEALIGPSLIFILTALTFGLVVNAIRAWLFDEILCATTKYSDNFFQQLGRGEKMLHYRVLVDEMFRYTQFYGGMSIALLPMFLGWLLKLEWHESCAMALISTVFFFFLEWRLVNFAMKLYKRFVERVNFLVVEVQEEK